MCGQVCVSTASGTYGSPTDEWLHFSLMWAIFMFDMLSPFIYRLVKTINTFVFPRVFTYFLIYLHRGELALPLICLQVRSAIVLLQL